MMSGRIALAIALIPAMVRVYKLRFWFSQSKIAAVLARTGIADAPD